MDFDRERKAWDQMKAALLRTHPGQYAVFDGLHLVGIEPTHTGAVTLGIATLRKLRFLVQHVVEHDEPVVVPAYVCFA